VEAEFLHNLYVSILEPEFLDHDIWFLNHQARWFLTHADPKHAAYYYHHRGLIEELFTLVPERLRDKLVWSGPNELLEPASMRNQRIIQGKRVALRPAIPEDGPQVLEWLLRSDVTPSMLGPPLFSERPVPEPGDSSQTFDPHYLDGTAPELGRCFLILVDGEPVGQVTYNDIVERDECKQVELDIWMRSESCCGKGYGTDALDALCGYLHEICGVGRFMVQPSARNPRAIRAYEKAGFKRLELPIEAARELWGPNDYCDSVYMVRTVPRHQKPSA
jgi:RimJ/RimL family protein N-acetyltransferase